jgi:hypothetical protein
MYVVHFKIQVAPILVLYTMGPLALENSIIYETKLVQVTLLEITSR